MSSFTSQDCAHMARALRLAARGRYTAHPNPMVGCVIAHGDDIVADGWHQKTGEAHAEAHALQTAGERAVAATAYVTLEPCAHHGKTPPCADALMAAGIKRVVVAMRDPNTDIAGGGVEKLIAAGIEVQVGLMAAVAADLNRGFVKRMTDKRPFVCLKLASSIDGAIAMENGESQWITGPGSRDDVQRLRARSGAVMTGIGTVLSDDPSLNVRATNIETGGLQPLRVVLDSTLRMPSAAGMLALPGKTLVFCTADAEMRELNNAEVLTCAAVDGRVDVNEALQELARRGINEVLVEAGPLLAGHMIDNDLVDELVIYQAPHIMGSQTMRLLTTPGWTRLMDRRSLIIKDVRRIGRDTKITATLQVAEQD